MSFVLPYNVEGFSNFYRNEFITGFTHTTLATGQIDRKQAEEHLGRLNERSIQIMPSIFFNQEMLTGNQLEGGACSAVSFRIINEVFDIFQTLSNASVGSDLREIMFSVRLLKSVCALEEVATGSRGPDKAGQMAIRTEQMALNTITVDRDKVRSGNAVPEKIRAMATFYGLKVVESYPELRVKGNQDLDRQLSEQLNGLKEGVYFMRIIQEKYNHKLEEKGHSIVYIKTIKSEYYFDVALGCYIPFNEAGKVNLVCNALLSANARFGVDVMSLHRMEEESPISTESLSIAALEMNCIIYSSGSKENAVIIFSPAIGVSIDSYKSMAKNFCAQGFTVIAVDDAATSVGTPRLEESEIIKRGLKNGANLEKLVALIRKGHCAKISAQAKIGVVGHSLGGSASIEACRKTSEIQAAINMDGRIIDPKGISQPVLQMIAKQVKEDRSKYDAALEELEKSNASVFRIEFDAKHGDFSASQPTLIKKVVEKGAKFMKEHLV